MGKLVFNSARIHETATDRQEGMPWWDQSVIREAKVLVVGAGAIGNETLKNLALLGLGYVVVCDMDTVSLSNLSRTVLFGLGDLGREKAPLAAERFTAMNVDAAHARADVFTGNIINRLGTGVFRRVDVVLGCLDNIKTRLFSNYQCNLTGKPYLDAGIDELNWSLKTFHYPETACFACHMPPDTQIEQMTLDRSASCSNVKQRLYEQGKAATIQVSSAMVSALQVQECAKMLHKVRKGALHTRYMDYMPPSGMEYFMNGMVNDFMTIAHTKSERCLFHHTLGEVHETPLTCESTVREALRMAQGLNGGKPVRLLPDTEHAFVETATCRQCGETMRVMKPFFDVYEDDLFCPRCADTQKAERLANVVSHMALEEGATPEEILSLNLYAVGTPKLHVLTFADTQTGDLLYLETTGDLPAVLPNLPR